MRKTFTDLPGRVKRRLRRLRRSTSDAGLALRCQMVLHACEKHSSRAIAQMLGCSRSCVSRVIRRFEEHGGAGLYDRREDNGVVKVDDSYLGQLQEVVSKVPLDFGYHRPTWTRELLVAVMRQRTGEHPSGHHESRLEAHRRQTGAPQTRGGLSMVQTSEKQAFTEHRANHRSDRG